MVFDAAAYYREKKAQEERELPGASSAFQTRRAGRVYTRYFNRHLQKPLGIRSTQVDVLAGVKNHRNSQIRLIADKLSLAPCTLSRSLKCLEANGLVTMVATTHDRRQRWPKLTPAGEDVLARATETIAKGPQLRMHTRLGPDMIRRLRTDSEKIDDAIHNQTREERWVDAGIPFWNRAYQERKWSGMSEEDIWKDLRGKPPPKKSN